MSHQVQEHEIRFALFTRNLWNVSLTKDNLCLLDRNEDIKILTHGKADYAKPQWILDATDIYLQQGNPNVIQVDWTDVAGLGLITPIYKARDAGEYHKNHCIHQQLFAMFSSVLLCKADSENPQKTCIPPGKDSLDGSFLGRSLCGVYGQACEGSVECFRW